MNKKIKTLKGAVALTTLLVISTVLVITGISVVYLSIDSAAVSRNYFNFNRLKSISQSCVDDAMLKISINKNYTGTGALNLNSASCNFVVTNDSQNSNYKDIVVNSTYEINSYTESYKADISSLPPEIID